MIRNRKFQKLLNESQRLFEAYQKTVDNVSIELLEQFAIKNFYDEKLFAEFQRTVNDDVNHKQPLSVFTYYVEFLYDKYLSSKGYNLTTADLVAEDIDVLDSIQYVFSKVLVGRNFEKYGFLEIQ